MTRELIGDYPAASDREQMGRFLRHAFPLGFESLAELLSVLKDDKRVEAPSQY
jgi:hypothetical protein